MVKKFEKQAAQGDVFIRRVRSIPKGATKREPENGRVIVAHSETGHHHSLVASGVERWEDPTTPLVCFLRVESPLALLEHERAWDTHETLELTRGTYEIRRQEELTPKGWRQVQD